MKKNVLVIEDKRLHMEALCRIIDELEENIEVYRAYDAVEAYKMAMENHIHLFLVDIILKANQSGDVSGLRFVQEMRGVKRYLSTPIIFITSLEDPKLYSYSQLHCFGYIEKPFDVKQVQKGILEALETVTEAEDRRCVYFRKDGIIYSKYICDITYIEISRRKIIIHCVNDVLEVPYKTCNEILRELGSDMFIQCSRYTIVNKEFIEQMDLTNRYIKLKGMDEMLEIGVTMKKKFGRAFGYGMDIE